jgi:hypothetical protein
MTCPVLGDRLRVMQFRHVLSARAPREQCLLGVLPRVRRRALDLAGRAAEARRRARLLHATHFHERAARDVVRH